ncbi:hypothetical protein GCM10011348_28530 [Marinobacterium nitratireducens]|uniref:Initiator Rep protein WH1 domain-containing protein n=1 Tax=Marinobacterium nitratireducens TaxID=518897 RepID=A0A917ZJS8_9GAMM|nr:replication initiation protein [Marinobacterium nitratireducens]GGO83812.1 hypothetical protein GCM10011348_28530 [Marinobacterium nitratireducens]
MDDGLRVLSGELVEDENIPEAIQVQSDMFEQELHDQKSALVYKRNEIIHGHFSMRTLALKTFSCVLSKLDPRSTEFHPVNFSRTELARLVKITRQSMYELVDDLTTELQQAVVKVPYIDKDWEEALRAERIAAQREGRKVRNIPKPTGGDSYVKVNLFQKAAYNAEANLITFVFNERLKDYLIDLRGNFTYYQLNSVITMSSGHAIRLYEILRAALSLKAVASGVYVAYKTIPYSELRDMLNIAPSAYPRFSLFERDVLRKAQKQMDGGDLTFTYTLPDRTTPKSRAPVKSIRFKISATQIQPNGDDVAADDWKLLLIQTFTPAALTKLRSTYSEECLKRNVNYYQDQVADGQTVSKVSGWLRKAFKDDYAGIAALRAGVHVKEAMQADFIKDQLLKLWPTLPQDDQDDFLANGFESECIEILYQGYRTLKANRAKTEAKRDAKQKRADVSASIMDIKDTDW